MFEKYHANLSSKQVSCAMAHQWCLCLGGGDVTLSLTAIGGVQGCWSTESVSLAQRSVPREEGMTQILLSSVLSCISRLLGGVLFIFHNNCVPYSLHLGRGEEPQTLVEEASGSSGSGLYKKDKHIITPGAAFALLRKEAYVDKSYSLLEFIS